VVLGGAGWVVCVRVPVSPTSLSFFRAAWAEVRSTSNCFLQSFSSVSRASSRDTRSWLLLATPLSWPGDNAHKKVKGQSVLDR